MRYLSVCAGIEAATVAWHHMGWQAAAYSEIEPFPSAVLQHHYPDVPKVGDMTKYKEWDIGSIDLLVGGTPCQSFSVAGLRKGMADPRGNLALVYCGILDHFRPKWFIWENVPCVLSSNGGRDFGSFLGALAQLGYGFAYRVLDAQFFGVAQRRKRVFVVGCLGNWRPAAAVLFERDSLCGNPKPSREKGEGTAATSFQGVECGSWWDGGQVAGTLTKEGANGAQRMPDKNNFGAILQRNHHAVAQPLAFQLAGDRDNPSVSVSETAFCLSANPMSDRGQAIGAPTLTKADVHGVAQPIAYSIAPGAGASKEDIYVTPTDTARTLDASVNNIGNHQGGTAVMQSMAVRRLTPIECERLQGFPDKYTEIPWRKKEQTPDGPRYKALGNSMAVPVMRWIGERINGQN